MANKPITVTEFFVGLTAMVFEQVAKCHKPLFDEFRDWAKENGFENEVFHDQDSCDGVATNFETVEKFVTEKIWPYIHEGFNGDLLQNDDDVKFKHVFEAPARIFFEVREQQDYVVSDGLMRQIKIDRIISEMITIHQAESPDSPWYEEFADTMYTAFQGIMEKLEKELMRFKRTERLINSIG